MDDAADADAALAASILADSFRRFWRRASVLAMSVRRRRISRSVVASAVVMLLLLLLPGEGPLLLLPLPSQEEYSSAIFPSLVICSRFCGGCREVGPAAGPPSSAACL